MPTQTVDPPLVTIGLSVYNVEETVASAIESVLAQTYGNWELIIIDDGSTDCTRRIVQGYNDKRIRTVLHPDNLGLPYRLNEIARLASGDLVARHDGDDILHPDRIRRQVEFMVANPRVDVVGSSMYVIDKENRVLGLRQAKPVVHTVQHALRASPLMHGTVMARRSWMLKNPYDTSLRRAQDRELWCRTIEASTFANLIDPLYFYREGKQVSPAEFYRTYKMNADVRLFLIRKYWRAANMNTMEYVQEIARVVAKRKLYRLFTMFGIRASPMMRRSTKMLPKMQSRAEVVLQTLLDRYRNDWRQQR